MLLPGTRINRQTAGVVDYRHWHRDLRIGVLPVAERRLTVRPASSHCSQRMLPLWLRDHGKDIVHSLTQDGCHWQRICAFCLHAYISVSCQIKMGVLIMSDKPICILNERNYAKTMLGVTEFWVANKLLLFFILYYCYVYLILLLFYLSIILLWFIHYLWLNISTIYQFIFLISYL